MLEPALARTGAPEVAIALAEIELYCGNPALAIAALDEALARAVATASKASLHRARANLELRLGHAARAALERAAADRLDQR